MPSLLLCFTTPSFAIVDATSTTNTSDPGGGVPWANVGRVNGGSGEYLGNGWVLTAAHVGTGAIVLDSGTFQPDGRVIRLKNPADNSPTDILLYHLILTPNLAALPISATTPGTTPVLDLVGVGRIRGSAEHAFGSYTGFDWSGSGVKSYGTNKRLTTVGTQNDLGYGTLQAFAMDFDQSGTAHEAQVATGDSGGAVFYKRGNTWELAGMIDALASYVYPQSASVYGDWSYIADLATYSSQINTLVATTAGGANWNGTSGSTWSTAGNWSSSPVPGGNNIHTATFNSAGNGNTTVSLGTGVTINTVLFDTASAAAYTIGSGAVGSQTLILKNGGAITTSNTVANSQLFNAAITLGTDATAQTYTISNNTTASPTPSVTLAGGITGATGGTAGAKTLAVAGTGHTAISGGISTGGAASLTVTKTGSGTLDLSGTQSYAALSASGGTTNVNGTLGAGTSSVSVSGNGTTLKFGSVSQTLSSLTIGVGTTTTFTDGVSSFAGLITGPGTVVKTGTDRLTLPNANDFTGTTTISGGILTLTSAGALGATIGVRLQAGGNLELGGTLNTNRINDNARLSLEGGDLYGLSGNETMQGIDVSADSAIHLQSDGVHGDLDFLGMTHTGGVLRIYNWVGTVDNSGHDDRIFIFGSLHTDMLASIYFDGYAVGAAQLGTGEIVPAAVPEPGALGLLCLAGTGLGLVRRRRRSVTVVGCNSSEFIPLATFLKTSSPCSNARSSKNARILAASLASLLFLAAPSFAIIDATSMTNTADPGGGVPWANVGSVGGGSGEYLGNGWVLTAAHVGAGPIGLDSGTFQPDGRVIRLKNPDNSLVDILLYHLVLTPSLPDLTVSGSSPATDSAVSLVGYGRIRGSSLKTYSTTYPVPNNVKSGFDWSATGTKSYGTNKIQYGVEEIFINGAGTLWAFTLDFTQSPAVRTPHEAQVATGDSGGAVFFKNGATWELAGMIDALGSWVYPQPASVYGDVSYIADLATYSSQINAIVASTAAGANWNGASGSTWSTAGNWSSSPVPGTSNINTATFNSAGGVVDTINLDSGVTINTVLFDTVSAAAYTIGSGAVGSQTLTLKNGGAITTSSTVSNGQLFNAALTLGDDATAQTYTISNNTAPSANPSLTLAGSIAGATGGTAGAKTLAVVGTGHTAISGGISTGGAAALAVNKSGSGTLDLAGTQTYAALTAAGGTTHVNSALGSGGSTVSVSGNGTALKFGTVSQRLSSLTIGAGATVTFTSGPASFADTDDTKALSFGGGPPAAGVVPEPGTAGLLLLGAISVLSSRRKRPL